MDSNTKIVFLGNPVPESLVERGAVHDVNMADNIAQSSVIEGLHERYGENLIVISVSSEKHQTELQLDSGIVARAIGSNSRNAIFYYLSVLINYTKALREVLKRLRGEHVIVITNGPYIYRALAAILAKRKQSHVKWVPFLIGAVEVPEARFPLSLVSRLSRWTVRQADGAITYVSKSVEDYMPGKPYVEIVYLIDRASIATYGDKQVRRGDKFTIAYTGALTSIYNLDVVLEAIRRSGNRYRWVFAGVGQYEADLEKLANDERYDVEYLGRVSNLEAIRLQMSSNLLLCLKGGSHSKVNSYYSKYAASGKMTEYLCSGTPILAADIPAFSTSIRPFATFLKNQNVEQVLENISQIVDNYEEMRAKADQGREYALKYFTSDYQSQKIYEFLESLDRLPSN